MAISPESDTCLSTFIRFKGCRKFGCNAVNTITSSTRKIGAEYRASTSIGSRRPAHDREGSS